MDKNAVQKVMPVNPNPEVKAEDFLGFQSGYVQWAIRKFPKMGSKLPWRLVQNYLIDLVMLRMGKLDGGKLQYIKRR